MDPEEDKRVYCAFPNCGKKLPKIGGYYCDNHVLWPQPETPSAAQKEQSDRKKK